MASCMESRLCPQYPNSSKLKALVDSSKIRITTFSPSMTGNVDTRSANISPFKLILKRPSCGERCSSILRLLSIFIRLTNAPRTFLGSLLASRKTPSILYVLSRLYVDIAGFTFDSIFN